MDIMLYAIPVFFLLIGVELLFATLRQVRLYRLSDAISNISCGITQQVTGVFFKIVGLTAYLFLYEYARVTTIPITWWSLILLFLLIDFCYYWFHRYSHEINIFWGAHVVHHQSEEYNLSVALRQSAFQGFISSVFYLPLAVLGFQPEPFIIINILQTLYQFWIHTEMIRKLPKWFEYIFNTPSHHRVHHGRNPQYIDRNHGGTLIIFDRIFGSFEPEKESVVYGVTKPLGTWSPIWANFDYYADLWKDMLRIPKFTDKLRLWVEQPGWLPEELGGLQVPPPTSRATAPKFNTVLPKGFGLYVIFQYVLTLGGATLFLALAEKMELQNTILIATLVLWAVYNLGAMTDRKKNGLWSEYLRLLMLPIALYLLLNGFSPLFWVYTVGSILSFSWLVFYHPFLNKNISPVFEVLD